jgi:hypothetical protein
MNTMPMTQPSAHAHYELRFQSLFEEGRAFAFSCDEAGHVDIDTLSTQARLNYFYARTVIAVHSSGLSGIIWYRRTLLRLASDAC